MDLRLPLAGAPACTDEVCITCSDEGRPAEIVAAPDGPFGLATARSSTGDEQVDVTLVAPVTIGDVILIHAGVAITKILDGAR